MQREKWLRRGITLGFIVATAMFFVAVYFSIQASASNEKSLIAANTAEAASTEAIAQKALAEAASFRALYQQATAEAASIEAYAQKALAEAASLRALDQQATAEAASAQAEIEKAKAVEQEVIAKEQREEAQKQKQQAEASSLVAQSLIQQIRLKDDLANLLAAEAFLVNDFTRTRTQMLATIYSRGRLPLAQGQSGAVITGLGYTPDNSGLVAAYFKGCQKANHYQCDRGVIRTWNIQRDNRPGSNLPISLQLNNNLIDPPGFLDAGAVSPDGSSVATAACLTFNTDITRCREESVQLWNISTRQPAGAPISITGEIASDKDVQLAFSPDGKTLAVALNINTLYSAARDTRNTISLWNLENNGKIGEFTPPGDLTTIAFSPDGKTLALAVGNGVTLLDSSSLEPMDLSAATRTRRILSLAFSPDGKTLATGADDGLITLINLQSGVPGERPLVNTSRVLALAFSPDGKILAAGYQDAGLVLWDVPGNQRLIIPNIYKHNEDPDVYPIYSLAFSPDGNQLASTSDEIIIWDMDPDSWVNKACLIAGRNFSQPEWKQFFGDEPYHQTCPQFPAGK